MYGTLRLPRGSSIIELPRSPPPRPLTGRGDANGGSVMKIKFSISREARLQWLAALCVAFLWMVVLPWMAAS